ncbi:MAG TPA: NAD(P)-dependent oxidoreductase [Lapillicoccus sp.]|nr:NAD(P)-dependent oxidoreductase [Lapillicoccus sp.]
MEPASRVGVIGLGRMGRRMARHLAAAHSVSVTGRGGQERFADVLEAGAQWCDSPRDVAGAADVVVLMLPDLPQVEDVLAGGDGLLAAEPDDLLLVVSSTSSPTEVRRLGDRLVRETEGRVRLVDAPVSGGTDGAEAATLSIMVGGADADARRAMTVLEACGRPVHLGPLGSGQVAKACNQLIVSAAVLALGEAAVLADRSGLELGTLVELFEGGYADSRILRTRGPRMVADDFRPSGMARYLLKDLEFATDVATATRTDTALLPALRAAFADLVARGLGDQDMAVTKRYVEERSRRR